jgi:hypothetical protein
MSAEAAPLIVSALFGAEDFAWLESLRRAHYPPERNRLPAHLTLFHHLPPSVAPELRHRLAEISRCAPPAAETAGLIDMGGGTALRIHSPALEAIRGQLAEAFTGLLTPQDQAGWRPHVTIQNKVSAAEARQLRETLKNQLKRRALRIDGLAAWAYREGAWEPLSRHMFRG